MKKHIFKDSKNLIKWDIIPGIDVSFEGNKQTLARIDKYVNILNNWDDKAIDKFIVNDEKFGDLIKSLITEDYSEYTTCFALDSKDNPQGVVVLSPSMRDKCNIEYIVIDQKHRRKGLGTRMISSIRDNIQEFMGYYRDINEINALVRSDNEPSQKAFLKSHFVCKMPTQPYCHKLFTFKPRENEHTI